MTEVLNKPKLDKESNDQGGLRQVMKTNLNTGEQTSTNSKVKLLTNFKCLDL